MISANGGLPAHRYTPQVTQRWPRGSEPASLVAGTKRTVEQDRTQLLPPEPDPHGCAVTFDFTADAFDSNNDREEDEYTAERILSDKPVASTPQGRLYKVRWKGFAASRDSGSLQAAFCRGTRPYGWTTSKSRTSS